VQRLSQTRRDRLSNVDVNLIDITGLTTTFDSSASTPKGHIRLVKKNDPTKYIIFKNGAVTAGFGAPYKNILVTALAWSSANPFAADDARNRPDRIDRRGGHQRLDVV
jgi:hypothetical protein